MKTSFLSFILILTVASLARPASASDKSLSPREAAAADCFREALAPTLPPVPFQKEAPKTLDELFDAFQKGLIPDLNNEEQKTLFKLYQISRLGDPSVQLDANTFEVLGEIMVRHPELGKVPFAPVEVTIPRTIYQPASELEPLFASLKNITSSIRSFGSGNKESLALIQKIGDPKTFDSKSSEFFKTWIDRSLPQEERYKALFKLVDRQRKKANPENADALSRVEVDIANAYAFDAGSVQAEIGNKKNGMTQLRGAQKILARREDFATLVGLKRGYQELTERVGEPSGVDHEFNLSDLLKETEASLDRTKTVLNESTGSVVRPLSLAEAPLRSCLGLDCASRTYLEKAMEERYQYFTLTDKNGHSQGHVTIVLGAATSKEGPVKVAFIDKIQNFPNADLPWVIEAVRQSAAQEGYTLSFPTDLGDHNGISNVLETRKFIEEELKTYTEQKAVLKSFFPQNASVEFENRFSRAFDKLDVKPVLPLKDFDPNAPIMTLQSKVLPWKADGLNLNDYVEATRAMRDGDNDQKRRYVANSVALMDIDVEVDPDFTDVVQGWMDDPAMDLGFKTKVLTSLVQNHWPELAIELASPRSPTDSVFTPQQQANILQNWLQTPALLQVLQNHGADLILMARSDKSLTQKIGEMIASKTPKEMPRAIKTAAAFDDKYLMNTLGALARSSESPLDKGAALSRIKKLAPKYLAENGSFGKTAVLDIVKEFDGAPVFEVRAERDAEYPPKDESRLMLSKDVILKSSSGTLIWEKNFKKIGEFKTPVFSKAGEPIALPDQTVVISAGNTIYWLKNGQTIHQLTIPTMKKPRHYVREVPLEFDETPALLRDGSVLVIDEHLGAYQVKDGKLIRGPISLTKSGTTQKIFSSGGDTVAQILLDSGLHYDDIGLLWIKNGKPGETKTSPGVKILQVLPMVDGQVLTYGITANPNNPSKLVKWISPDGKEKTHKINEKGHEQSHLKSIQTFSDGSVFLHLTDPWKKELLVWLKDGKETGRFEGQSLQVSTADPDVVVAMDSQGILRWFKDGQETHSIQVDTDTRYLTPIVSFPDGTVVAKLANPSRVAWYRDGIEIGKINKSVQEIHALPNGQTELLGGNSSDTDVLIGKPSSFSVELPKPNLPPKNP